MFSHSGEWQAYEEYHIKGIQRKLPACEWSEHKGKDTAEEDNSEQSGLLGQTRGETKPSLVSLASAHSLKTRD